MAKRFTVIQGGRSEGQPVGIEAPARGRLTLAWSRDAGAEIPRIRPEATGLTDGAALEAIDRAIRLRLATLNRPVEPVQRPVRAARSPTAPRAIPMESFLGVRPEGWALPATRVPVFDDRAPVAVAPSEITRGRLSAWSGALRHAFLARVEAIAAGTLSLNIGPIAWRRARG
ncbi:hypothetical protein [Methylobacterium pseudosasicola]|uniref:Uncharacterized protein n=1 Tax=Methylobacterium pseudosasicola TaxID=582667 RepID=A0A1I4LAY9_9HYPH|nr:hypothetical protein [Methylobacterium pseudosasicola]SFL88162.1 hypothetical protein SAMN05192568_101328 [Methylobacterium pseudosasicola]